MIGTVDETLSPLLDPVVGMVDETLAPLLDPVIGTVDETIAPLLDPVIGRVNETLSPLLDPVIETLSPLLPVGASTPQVVEPLDGSNEPAGTVVSDAPPAFNPPVPAGQVDNMGATSPLAPPEPTVSSPGVTGRTDIGSPSGTLATPSSGLLPFRRRRPPPSSTCGRPCRSTPR